MVKKSKKPQKLSHERIMDTKWKSLRARGYTPSADVEENKRRLREAHHGIQ